MVNHGEPPGVRHVFLGSGGGLEAPAPTAAGGGFARQRLGATAGSQGLAEVPAGDVPARWCPLQL